MKALTGSTSAPVDADAARKRRQQQFLGLISAVRDAEEKRHREIADLLLKLEEIATTGQTSTAALELDFVRLWEAKTGETYQPNHAADRGALRRLLRTLAADELRRRMVRYFERSDAFVRNARWSLMIFVKDINTLGGNVASSATKDVDDLLRGAGFYEQ